MQIRSYDPERNLVNNQPEADDQLTVSGWNLTAQAIDRLFFLVLIS
jgi:hypothetical protein